MGRKPCCMKEGLNRGAWSAQEDRILVQYINAHGEGKWRDLPARAGLKRCGKSCRLRWLNYLNPNIKRGNISPDEEDLIIRLHNLLGNRWSLIAGRLPGRTDNEIKNYWNTSLSKKIRAPRRHEQSSDPAPKDDESARDAAVDRPHQVIRTKAARCNKMYPALPHQYPSGGREEADADKPQAAQLLLPTTAPGAGGAVASLVLLQESDLSKYFVDLSDDHDREQTSMLPGGDVDEDLFIQGWHIDIKDYGGDMYEGDGSSCHMLPDQLDEDVMEEWRRTFAFQPNV